MRRASFDLAQAGAAVRAGGVLGAILRADKGSFYIELETREAGVAELVTSNGRERRSFRDPGQALKVVRELGVATGRFALEEWDTQAPIPKAWSRPDQAAHMKAKHQRADDAAEFEADVLQALAEADDPSVTKIVHAEVMALLDAKVAQIKKKSGRKARA
ncbi:hypothetical protein [Caballeronia sordidicola]|uniref:Prevent host death protein, Phd antitoxin D n=1 Tax=Caballeronia sordidicola TaxID=196367 RepID=A0A242MGK2_CABSO|nr:hypothetical protein [Caballeronia sordidicola]OTP70433.1 Prevent host death protein, Phd antitoxin D [Caballeronia sordidicola]OTP74143.1 hypothetical protein PAMC26510_17295 [Caballeronia sordidicola]